MESTTTPLEQPVKTGSTYSREEVQAAREKLVFFDHPLLRKSIQPFIFEDNDPTPIIDELYDTMLKLESSGLSANQIGIDARIMVVGDPDTKLVFINPEIVGATKEQEVMDETSSMAPDFTLALRRPVGIVIRYQRPDGETVTESYYGITARIIQHEYDFLNGVVFTQRASNFKYKRAIKKMKNSRKKAIRRLLQTGSVV